MSQASVSDYGNIAKAEAGQKYDIRPDVVTSFAAEGAVPFGLAVTRGTNKDKQCDVIDNAADSFLGVALKEHTVVQTGDTAQYEDTDTVAVLEQGACWVEVTSDVAAGAAAYVDVANGKFTDVATDNLAVPGGKFITTATSGNLAALAIN